MSSIIALGERTLFGKYNKVYAAGEMHIDESEITSLYGAGEIQIKQSKIKKVRVAGELQVDKSLLGDVNAIGEINLTGVTKAQYMVVRGEVNVECLECKHLVIGDKSDKHQINNKNGLDTHIKGFLKTEILENYSELQMDFECEIINLVNGGRLKSADTIECDTLYSFGSIESEEINAETVYIRPLESSKVNMIVGSKIQITQHYQLNKFLKEMKRKYFKKYYEKVKQEQVGIMAVSCIEGDYIQLDHVKAEHVSGIDVTIGELCIIDRVEYSGSIQISPKAVVNEVVKL